MTKANEVNALVKALNGEVTLWVQKVQKMLRDQTSKVYLLTAAPTGTNRENNTESTAMLV